MSFTIKVKRNVFVLEEAGTGNWFKMVAMADSTGAQVDLATEATLLRAALALEIIDDWDEANRAKVNPVVGQAGIAANAGAMSNNTTRVVISTNDTHFGVVGAAADVDGVVHGQLRSIAEAVEIMDDWDESDRAKVNTIAGQIGIAAGTGVLGATTTRITVATNDPVIGAITSAAAGADSNGTVIAQIRQVNKFNEATRDGDTNALAMVTYAHHEIHSGTHYVYRCYDAITKAGTKELLIVTPAGTAFGHVTIGFDMLGSTTVVELFEGVTTSNDGALALTRNRNRNTGDDNTILVYEDPTVTDGAVAANRLQCGIFGAGKNSFGGGTRDNEEMVYLPETKYLLRFTEQDTAATSVNYSIDWYRHSASSPP